MTARPIFESYKKYFDRLGIEMTIENAVAVSEGSHIKELVKAQLFDSVKPGTALLNWIKENVSPERRRKTAQDSLQLFVEMPLAGDETADAKEEALSMMNLNGVRAAVIRRVFNRPSKYVSLTPNTAVPVHYGGKTFEIKVEHYIDSDAYSDSSLFRADPVIKTRVIEDEALNSLIGDAAARKLIYDQVYVKSAKYFAFDIKDNKKSLQNRLGVGGVGMIFYKGALMEDLKVNGRSVVEDNKNIGVIELKTDDEKSVYFDANKMKEESVGLIMSEIAALEERGRNWTMPGHEYALSVDADKSFRLLNESAASRYMDNEKSKNVSTVRVSSSKMKETIDALWTDKQNKSKTSGSEIDKIRNLLNTGKELRKAVDMKVSDLLNTDGTVNTVLIQRAYEIGFNGIYADLTGADGKAAAEIIKIIGEMSKSRGIDIENYMLFDRNNHKTNTDMISEYADVMSSAKITGVVVVGGKNTAADVENAVGKLSNIALEMKAMERGDELLPAQGRAKTIFFENTKGLSKDASRISESDEKDAAKKIAKIYNSAYKRALSSEYTLKIDSKNIEALKPFMSLESGGKAGFEELKNAMDKAGIAADSVVYRYVMQSSKDNTPESLAAAKAYLRASVENSLEREYIAMLGTTKDRYYQNVAVSDINALRALLIYLAVNGEKIDAGEINAIMNLQREYLSGDSRSIAALRADPELNAFINEIMADPINASGNRVENAKRALTVLNDSIAGFASIDNLMKNAKDGALMSASAVRGLLTAA
jgi:hypothetical protein